MLYGNLLRHRVHISTTKPVTPLIQEYLTIMNESMVYLTTQWTNYVTKSSHILLQTKLYTYTQMLQEKYCKEFFNAMLEEIEVHEKREHWTLMNRNEMPTGAKKLWQSGP